MLAAFGPALRAGRLSAIEAIAAGRAPRSGRGYAAHRLAARLRLPRPVGLGARRAVRPARPHAGDARRGRVRRHRGHLRGRAALLARPRGRPPSPSPPPSRSRSSRAATAPGRTRCPPPPSWPQPPRRCAPSRAPPATVTPSTATRSRSPASPSRSSRSRSTGRPPGRATPLIAGHWYDAPGEVDVNTSFLDAAASPSATRATVDTGTADGHRPHRRGGLRPVTPAAPLRRQPRPCRAPPRSRTSGRWNVGLRPGTNATAYVQAVNAKLGATQPVRRRWPARAAASSTLSPAP